MSNTTFADTLIGVPSDIVVRRAGKWSHSRTKDRITHRKASFPDSQSVASSTASPAVNDFEVLARRSKRERMSSAGSAAPLG